MHRHRLHLLVLLLFLALAAVAAGCGGDDDDGGEGAATTEEGAAVSGSISIMGIWVDEEQASFQAVIDGFTEQNPDVTVNYNPAGDNLPTVLSTAVEGGNPPDIAAIAQPGLMQGFVEGGELEPIDYVEDVAVENFGQSVVDTGSVDGTFYGLMFKGNNKSTVWYNVQAFEDAGVEAATTWDELLEAAGTISASGLPAYSIAGSQGWTLTDLFENIYLRTAGGDMYDQLSTHEIPWTDESVKEALREMAKILGDADNIVGGVSGALQTDFPTSVSNVFSASPKAAMVLEGDFVPGVVEHPLEPETGFNVFEFPSINDSPPVVVGAGNLFITFRTSPAVQAFIEYLATPEAAQIWVERGGFSSPNKQLDSSAYPDPILAATATALAEAETFRFDLSDLQPSEFGATEGQGMWKLFQDFLQNPDDVDGIAEQLEQAASAAFD
jgi:ABC-type glycerol-3-phosphate transport system substrate-binding protein